MKVAGYFALEVQNNLCFAIRKPWISDQEPDFDFELHFSNAH